MFATICRYESIDQSRTSELVKQIDDSLLPKLSELPGFTGYYVIEAGHGILSTVGFFDTSEHADQSTRFTASWVSENKFDSVLSSAPKVTSGEVIAQTTRELVQA